jgi:hypothetical protein
MHFAVESAAFLNAYFQFYIKAEPVLSFCAGGLLSFVSLVNYLGDTRMHMCCNIIEELMNKDPELIKRIKDVRENKHAEILEPEK